MSGARELPREESSLAMETDFCFLVVVTGQTGGWDLGSELRFLRMDTGTRTPFVFSPTDGNSENVGDGNGHEGGG